METRRSACAPFVRRLCDVTVWTFGVTTHCAHEFGEAPRNLRNAKAITIIML